MKSGKISWLLQSIVTLPSKEATSCTTSEGSTPRNVYRTMSPKVLRVAGTARQYSVSTQPYGTLSLGRRARSTKTR